MTYSQVRERSERGRKQDLEEEKPRARRKDEKPYVYENLGINNAQSSKA
jgi:hypothetical protein